MENTVKRRFDNAGTEFGIMHRQLPSHMYMFDVDRLHVNLSASLKMKKENEMFIEYRHMDNRQINFVAMFELKYKKTESSIKQSLGDSSNAVVRAEMCKRLGCRLFVVFSTNGYQPFEFYEINTETNENTLLGILDYDKQDRNKKLIIDDFWNNVLKIPIAK